MEKKENKMGVMNENKLLISMALPMMISMLVQALYNIVDSIFVSMVNENALTAVSLAFPIQVLMIAVGGGTGVGVNALLSKSLGEKEHENVNKAAENGIFLAILSFVLFLIVGIFFSKIFFQSQTNDAQILEYGTQYMTVITCMSFGLFGQLIFERLLQATGKSVFSMITQGIGAITNLILDPILIFGLFGMPKLGVTGAALATVIGQIIAASVGMILNMKYNSEIKLFDKKFRPDLECIKKIYIVGLPSIIMQAIGSVMTYGINIILISFSATATAVFGVYFKLQSFIFMPVFGLNNALIPIIAYNFGAKNRDRVIKTIKISVVYSVSIMAIGFVVFQVFTAELLSLFQASDLMLEIGVKALRIISISFIVAGYCIICGSVFQALGNGVYSLIVSIARQLVVILPVAYLLSLLGNVNLVWWAFPISEIVSLIISTIFMIKIYQEVIKKIGE
ncbi:MAG: MATE family efflux transporter [Lachnospiraceae bacterium]